MMALGIIFVSLIALDLVVTRSMTYIGFARQRDTANSLADQTMEQLRALPFATVQAGLDNTDLAGTADTNILKGGQGGCPAGSYCFPVAPNAGQCPSGVPAYGERIPHGTNANLTPIVPHQHTQTVGPTTFTVSSYISYLCDQLTTNTFRVTVTVSWPNAQVQGVSSKVTTQSIFYSQSGGCLNSLTHPFAAPCQPFFYGTADVQGVSTGVGGTVQGFTFDPSVSPPATLDLPSFTSNMSIEQLSQVQGVAQVTGVTIALSGQAPQTYGYVKDTTNADNDPAQPGQTYQQTTPYPTSGPGPGSVVASGSGNSLTLNSSGPVTYGSTSTTAASLTNACANRSGTNQTDNQACGNANEQQVGTSNAVLRLKPSDDDLGNATLIAVGNPAAQSYGFTNRDVTPQPGTCAGTSGDGCVHSDAVRYLGTVTIGRFPANLNTPSGWSGYLIRVTSFTDQVSAESGMGGSNPSVTASGTLSYWNGTGYSSCTIGTNCSATVTTPLVDVVTTLSDNNTAEVKMPATTWTVNTTSTTKNVPPTAPDVLPGCVGTNTCIANASAASTSPISGDLEYQVSYALLGLLPTTVADVTIHVNLGTLSASTRYKPTS